MKPNGLIQSLNSFDQLPFTLAGRTIIYMLVNGASRIARIDSEHFSNTHRRTTLYKKKKKNIRERRVTWFNTLLKNSKKKKPSKSK